jgi:ABC-type antimicrobial peptide transport system ATPase subunit
MSAPLLEVEDVGRQFVARRSVLGRPTAIVTAVDGVSFSLEAGKTSRSWANPAAVNRPSADWCCG